MTPETKTRCAIKHKVLSLENPYYLSGLSSFLCQHPERRDLSIACFRLFCPQEEKYVHYGFLCPSEIVDKINFWVNINGELFLGYSSGKSMGLGNPNLGGLQWRGYQTRDVAGKKLGDGASYGRKVREARLGQRRLFADPIKENKTESVVLCGLAIDDSGKLKLVKLVNTSRVGDNGLLAEKVLNTVRAIGNKSISG